MIEKIKPKTKKKCANTTIPIEYLLYRLDTASLLINLSMLAGEDDHALPDTST